jgi:WD40 repeat protein
MKSVASTTAPTIRWRDARRCGRSKDLEECSDCGGAFSPDGARVLTASWDQTARLWEAASGKLLVPLEGHRGWVESAVFSPDGAGVLTASRDKPARLWRVFATTQDVVSHAKDTVPRCLTPEQRQRLHLPPNPPGWCRSRHLWPFDAAFLAVSAQQ